ncbi:MFS transporter [Nocardioides gansuensis]|uniref:MFS transporter n=1 Tax=Nocardioides gansuensis TaxID=2138300 RepID=UPI001FE337AC|nr:MFS transporter [Nocardioides gansuensis]
MSTTHAPSPAAAETGHLPGTPGYRRVLAAVFVAGMATFVLLYDTQALLPLLGEAFAVTPAQSTLTMSLTTAGLAGALLVAGPLSERVGRTRLIHLSLGSSVLVAVACAAAPTWEALLALRLLEGVALAGLPAVATAYLREELHRSAHARAAGLYIGGTALGGMAGRLVTAPVADVLGWRWAMAAAAAFALACAVVVWLLLPASRHFVARPMDLGHLFAMARAAGTDRALLALYALGACAVGALVAVFNALGFRLMSAPFGLSAGALSLVYLVYPLGTASSTLSGRLADRIGRRAIMPAGCVIALAGVGLSLTPSLPVIVLGVAVLAIGFFIAHGLASGWVVARAHAAGTSTGQAAALYLFAYYVGSSVFGNLGSAAWARSGWTGVSLLAGGLLVVACLLAASLRRIPPLLTTSGQPAAPTS